jgi:hypothetical protein
MKTTHDQKGFSAVEAIIILVVVAVLGLGGWYAWKKQDTKDTPKTKTSQAQSKSTDPKAAKREAHDPTAEWATYANAAAKFSFKHPKTWVFADNPEACTEGLVLFASDHTALGTCASESGGQMMVMGTDGDVRGSYKLGQGYLTDYTDVTEAAVTADGVTGTKQTAIASGQEGVGILPDGTKVVQYAFYVNGKTYVAKYTQRSTYPAALSDFEVLVSQTLKFSK